MHVGIGDIRRRLLKQSGIQPPPAIHLEFLVDTGASISWIDDAHMRALQLQPRSWEEVHTVSGRGVPTNFATYEVSLIIGGEATVLTRRFEILIGGEAFINQPVQGLLGRDVLNQFQLGWNGRTRELHIDYE